MPRHLLQRRKRGVPMLRFTRHIRHYICLYRLTEAEMTEALHQPDQVTPSGHGEKHAWKQLLKGWLRVTY